MFSKLKNVGFDTKKLERARLASPQSGESCIIYCRGAVRPGLRIKPQGTLNAGVKTVAGTRLSVHTKWFVLNYVRL